MGSLNLSVFSWCKIFRQKSREGYENAQTSLLMFYNRSLIDPTFAVLIVCGALQLVTHL